MPTFCHKNALDIPCNEKEAARYFGCTKYENLEKNLSSLLHQSCTELQKIIMPQAVYDVFSLQVKDGIELNFAGNTIYSKDLSKNLNGCKKVYLFAATIGPQVDYFIRRTQIIDKAKASILQAVGAMFAESFVDIVNNQIAQEAKLLGFSVKPRFSPGYGDLSLNTQKLIFSLLPCNRIGLTLMDSLIMAPEKSVTAFVGIA